MFSKQLKRKESKKRKLQSFLELAESNDLAKKQFKHSESSIPNKDNTDEYAVKEPKLTNVPKEDISHGDDKQNTKYDLVDDDLAELRAKKREMRKAKMQLPVFFIANIGHEAEFEFSSTESHVIRPRISLNIQDIQSLLLFSMLGRKSPFKTRWCKLLRYNKVSHVSVIIAQGLSVETFLNHKECLSDTRSLFTNAVEFKPSSKYKSIMSELCNVPLSIALRKKLIEEICAHGHLSVLREAFMKGNVNDSFKTIFPIHGESSSVDRTVDVSKCNQDNFDRLKLLLDPVAIFDENYPLFNVKCQGTREYTYTKEKYAHVTRSSPIFALDCEMCMTANHESELTRITIVNEDCNVVYDSLVLPEHPIIDYLTQFSGIDKSTLQGVTTKLKDVQNDIIKLLPPDAILCGHSLNFDLHALKMIHPYVIDTSIIYNITGIKNQKPSLKNLALIFLNERIQSSSDGHDPVEDSVTTMKLVQLKLRNSVDFGRALLDNRILEMPEKENVSVGDETANGHETEYGRNFFTHSRGVGKKACVLGKPELMEVLQETMRSNEVTLISENSNRAVVARTREVLLEHDLTMCHLDVDKSNETLLKKSLSKLDKRIKKIYASSAVNCLFMVIFSGSGADEIVKNGLCMTKIKICNSNDR